MGKLYPARESLVSDIPAGDGNIAKPFFYSVMTNKNTSYKRKIINLANTHLSIVSVFLAEYHKILG